MSTSAYVPMRWRPLNDTITGNPNGTPCRVLFWGGGALPIYGNVNADKCVLAFSAGRPGFGRIVGNGGVDKVILNFNRLA